MTNLLPLLMLAAAYWGQTPACGQPTITETPLPVFAPGLEVLGLAERGSCAIRVDPTRLSMPGSSCMVVVHEYGHLLGLGHSTDPEDVMYPVIRKAVWPCAW